MKERCWNAKWITNNSYSIGRKVSPVPMMFAKKIKKSGEIKKATLFATAIGIYQCYINGKKVGNCYFAPGFTSYEHQLQYQVYDVTDMLKVENTLSAVVAGGWAVGCFTYSLNNKLFADRQAFLAELVIEYKDGSAETVGTDASWEVSQKSNFIYADWYNGETYDATVTIQPSDFCRADEIAIKGNTKLLEQYGESVVQHEIIEPKFCYQAKSGEYIYDFGQNFAGVISAEIIGRQGQKITVRHAEVLMNNELFVRSLRTAKATATYICKDGKQTYSPTFTYMGFQYIGVSGITPEDIQLKGIVLHSDIPEIGTFECSNADINKLQQNIRWSAKSNFVDIPTDCPQRDERMGWTGDLAVFASTACFNFDMRRFLNKWLLDVKCEQAKGGAIPRVVPRLGDNWPIFATSCWGDSCILVPWADYLAYGNKALLSRQYATMTKFLKAAKFWCEFFSMGKTSRRIWKLPFHFGDWCAPNEPFYKWLYKGKWVATAYFANSCKIVAEIADILGKPEDKKYYLNLRKEICDAYIKRFTNGKGKLKYEFQTAYVLPLYFNMVEGETKKAMASNLVALIKKSDYHLTTGFPGSPYLLFALSDNGYADIAYKVLMQNTCSSWLYQVKAGATTIWERWDALRPDGTVNIGTSLNTNNKNSRGGMVSFNHYAYGAVGDFLYRRIAGIEATSGGYKTFDIKPIVGGDLSSAKASTLSPYGTISSNWHIDNGSFILKVSVPSGTIATVTMPNGATQTVNGGEYEFSCKL